MAYDPFNRKVSLIDQSARSASVVTPHDTDELDIVPRALYIGTTGDVAVVMADDETDTPIVFVGATGILPIMVKRVRATSTTASNILTLY